MQIALPLAAPIARNSMRSIVLMLLAFGLFFMGLNAHAQVATARGKASVPYEGSVFGSKASPEVKERAMREAQVKAVEFYYAEAGESESANFDAIRDRVGANLDKFILDATILDEQDQTDKRVYTVTVRTSINVAKLRNAVKAGSATTATAKGDRSKLTFLFVSRQVDSEKTFDDRVYQRVDRGVKVDAQGSDKRRGAEGESIRGGQIGTNASRSRATSFEAKRTDTIETGGSTTRKASESTWRIFPSANLNSVFTGIFASAGFKVLEAGFVEPYTNGLMKIKNVENDYKTGNDLDPATLRDVVRGLQTAQVPYLAFGTLDVGLTDTDPASGLQRVAVTVTGKILDLTSGIPENISTVGPVQYAGVGPTEAEARGNALKKAADSAARELVSQVTNLGLR
ncbi:hypothetical protein [Variovorax sp. LT1R16]|uniref:hypothetical protein n=1 Tax=Variovorax sp. LT1R16 TaxID=3443728 RepID=UPI003F45E87A